MWKPPPPLPCLSRCSMTSSPHRGRWRWTMLTPAKLMPVGHRIVDALPQWRPTPLAAMACLLCCRRPSTAQRLTRYCLCHAHPTLPLLPSLRCHRRCHRHLRPPPTAAALKQDNRAHVAYVLMPLPLLYLSAHPSFSLVVDCSVFLTSSPTTIVSSSMPVSPTQPPSPPT